MKLADIFEGRCIRKIAGNVGEKFIEISLGFESFSNRKKLICDGESSLENRPGILNSRPS